MSAAEKVLRETPDGYVHYCPGCQLFHRIPKTWEFDGNFERPTFAPRLRLRYDGLDAGDIRHDGKRAPAALCHYILSDGIMKFFPDSTHPYAGSHVPLLALPDGARTGIPDQFGVYPVMKA